MPSSTKMGLSSAGSGFTMTKNISNLSVEIFNKMESKVTAPKNPKLIRSTSSASLKVGECECD